MMSQRKKIPRTVDITCDECSSKFLETKAFNFRDASTEMREAGWVSAEIEGEWEHFCPECARKMGID